MAQNEHVAVVGAGLMGTGIAHAFFSSGHNVTLIDSQAAALDKARTSITKNKSDGVRLW
ncbi:MAG: NAD(P)-binding domain-containing protein, partial [Rhodoferax sp.]|nr:NAD(P)-binding domain-containing protein [Rhodoferax sp.]